MSLYDQIEAAGRAVADAADQELATTRASLAACQSARTLLQTQLTAATTKIADLEAEIVDLRAQLEPVDPFVLGETKPTAENTGCRIPKADLVHVTSVVTGTHPITGKALQRGDVISGVRVPRFAITVPGVIVRDCWVDGVGLPYTNPGTDYHRLVDCRASTGGSSDADLVVYEHVTVAPVTHSYLNVGFQGANFRAYRCYIRYVTDAFSTHSTGGQVARAADILGCYIENLYTDRDPNQGDQITHNDALQSAGKLRRLRFEGNAVEGAGNTTIGLPSRPRTSNILIQSNAGAHTGEGIIIRRNWLKGHQASGSTINIPETLSCPLVIEGNVLAANGKQPRVLIAAATRSASTTAITSNVLDTGAVATVNNA